jgi:LysR family transcriptional regulator, glycine cleavage system transcriptional activator
MRKGLPPVNWLRAFEVAARHLSFTGAARELGVTPSAISQQVRLLEQHIGATLFERLPRGLALSLAGEAYLPVVAESFERLSRGTAALFGGTADPDRLSLRSAAGFARFWLIPKLPRFLDAHPEITVRLSSRTWSAESFEIESDMEIRFGTGPWPGFGAERLTWDKVFPVCSPRLRSVSRLKRPEQVSGLRLIHSVGFREGWSDWLAAAGAQDVVPAGSVEFDSAVLSLELALAGEGVALSRNCFADALLADGKLVAPFPQQIEASEAFHLLWPAARSPSRSMQLFRDWILAEATETAPVRVRRRTGPRTASR